MKDSQLAQNPMTNPIRPKKNSVLPDAVWHKKRDGGEKRNIYFYLMTCREILHTNS